MLSIMYRVLILAFFIITVGQFAAAVYLPSLPAMAREFGSTPHALELTYTLLLVGYGVSMFVFGPLSDQLGRKKFILIGFAIFIVATIWALFSDSVTNILLARLLQGLGLGGVISVRALLKDVYHGETFLKAVAYMTMGIAITPFVAPVIGGYIEEYIGWQGNFAFMLIYALIIAIISWKVLPETVEKKAPFQAKLIFTDFKHMLTHKRFISLSICAVFVFAVEMSYAAVAPFLLQNGLGWTPSQYGWLTVLTVAGYFVGGFISSKLAKKYEAQTLVHVGVTLLLIGAVLFLLGSVTFNTWTILLPMMIIMAGISMTLSNTGAMSLILFECKAGTASALNAGFLMLGAGIISSLVSGLHLHNQRPLAWMMLASIIVANILFYLFIREKPASS